MSSSRVWFLYSNDIVTGPYSTDEVQHKLQSDADSFIWWKGQREWIPVTTWQSDLTNILSSLSSVGAQKPIWYVDLGSSPLGPLTQNELLETLQGLNDLGRARLWAVGMKKWQTLFELHDVMELLGISRRTHDRAPLMGSVAITRSNEDPRGFMAKAASISIAGIGVSNAHELRRGDEVALLIRSAEIPGNIHLRGEVVYVTDAGHAGIRFHQVQAEISALIHDYVKRFATDSKSEDSAA